MTKKTKRPSLSINYTPKYAIVDEDNNILETFRIRLTAIQMFKYYSDKYYPMELKIVKI